MGKKNYHNVSFTTEIDRYMVASWACEVIEILTQRSTEDASCV